MKASEHAAKHGLSENDVIKQITAGKVRGYVEEGVWHVEINAEPATKREELGAVKHLAYTPTPLYKEGLGEGLLAFCAALVAVCSVFAGFIFSFITIPDPVLSFRTTQVFTPFGLGIGASGLVTAAALYGMASIIKLLKFIAACLDHQKPVVITAGPSLPPEPHSEIIKPRPYTSEMG